MTRHVVHLVYRFSAGGLENMLVQLINGLPASDFRHTVVALTEVDAEFVQRIERDDVEIVALHKAPGQPFALYPAMYRLLRRLRPDVMHTCNLAALEFMPVAAMAGVPLRIHAEHGWDVADPDGSNRSYRFLRRVFKHFAHEFVAVSAQLYDYLCGPIALPPSRVHLIQNGVDTERFRPRRGDDAALEGWPFDRSQHFVIGTVGRLETIKNQALLIDAFSRLATEPAHANLRLAIVGAGQLAPQLLQKIEASGFRDRIWLPGSRSDVAEILRAFDAFVLPSLAEGTSCTLQEAMASALPIIATAVGGNPDLLEQGSYGRLIESDDLEALCIAIKAIATEEAKAQGNSARSRVERDFSIAVTMQQYRQLFKG